MREVDPALPIIRLRDMEDVFRDSLRRPRMLTQLLGAFAALALLLAGPLVLTRLMETLLFAVRPNDPATLAGVAAFIAAVAAAATLIPALRATRVDPLVALKDD